METLAGTTVVEPALTVFVQTGFDQHVFDLLLGGTVEHGGVATHAEGTGGPAKVGFEHLTHVHARRHAQRVEDDVDGLPSGRKGMFSSGTMVEITPLLPWRPAILSPTFRVSLRAMKTLTISSTPVGRSSPRLALRISFSLRG